MSDSFVRNVADAPAVDHPVSGIRILFESPEAVFPQIGVNIQVLRPGQPNAKYHSEAAQEDFLVLGGECLLLLDGEERPLRAWDFVHVAPGSAHVFVGAGDGPCWILAIGARPEDEGLDFPANDLAARHGASARESTTDGGEAYADWEGGPPPWGARRGTAPWPPRAADA